MNITYQLYELLCHLWILLFHQEPLALAFFLKLISATSSLSSFIIPRYFPILIRIYEFRITHSLLIYLYLLLLLNNNLSPGWGHRRPSARLLKPTRPLFFFLSLHHLSFTLQFKLCKTLTNIHGRVLYSNYSVIYFHPSPSLLFPFNSRLMTDLLTESTGNWITDWPSIFVAHLSLSLFLILFQQFSLCLLSSSLCFLSIHSPIPLPLFNALMTKKSWVKKSRGKRLTGWTIESNSRLLIIKLSWPWQTESCCFVTHSFQYNFLIQVPIMMTVW